MKNSLRSVAVLGIVAGMTASCSGSSPDETVSSSSDVRNKNCGADGQRCCSRSSCHEGLECLQNTCTRSDKPDATPPDAGGTGNVDAGGPPPSSPSCTILTGATGSIVDGSGNVWTLVTGSDGSLVVDENGAAAGFSDQVVELAYVSGVVSQENDADGWWSWTSGAWADETDPTGSCSTTVTPDAGTATNDSGSGGGGGGTVTKIFGMNQMAVCGAAATAQAASDRILADRLDVDPTQDVTLWGSSTATWFAALRVSGVRPWILLNQLPNSNYAALDPTSWANSVVTWYKTYGKGGTYWAGASDADLAPDTLEVFNEPYGDWFWSDINPTAYANLVKATRQALDAAGYTAVKVVASGDIDQWGSFFDTFASAGGLSYVDGIAIHPYGPVEAAGGWSDGWAGEQSNYFNGTFEQQVAAAEAWAPGKLIYMTEGGQNQTQPTSENGNSALVSATYAAAAYAAYANTGVSDPLFAAVLPYAWCPSWAGPYAILGTPAETAYSNAIPQ